jgi:hypothetical protein
MRKLTKIFRINLINTLEINQQFGGTWKAYVGWEEGRKEGRTKGREGGREGRKEGRKGRRKDGSW